MVNILFQYTAWDKSKLSILRQVQNFSNRLHFRKVRNKQLQPVCANY